MEPAPAADDELETLLALPCEVFDEPGAALLCGDVVAAAALLSEVMDGEPAVPFTPPVL